jgi:Barstar (barnase inhibitor)
VICGRIVGVARTVLFDPTTGQTFIDQWQRYDWRLLQNGAVHRVDDSANLRRAGELLAGLGYLVHVLDAASWNAEGDVHGALSGAFSFPAYCGRNLDALNDVLGDVAEFSYGSDPDSTGTVLAIDNYDRVVDMDPEFAYAVVDVFAYRARYAALLGHPMLCIVATTADLGEVGATRVLRETPLAEDATGASGESIG